MFEHFFKNAGSRHMFIYPDDNASMSIDKRHITLH